MTTMATTRKSRTPRGGGATMNAHAANPEAVVEAARRRRSRDGTVTNAATSIEASPRPTSKKAAIESLVRREDGATIPQLIHATGWQEHSIRAALTGLRKAGLAVARERDQQGRTFYRIVGAS
jgi:hypothetical protein